jgi:hypothetical protein
MVVLCIKREVKEGCDQATTGSRKAARRASRCMRERRKSHSYFLITLCGRTVSVGLLCCTIFCPRVLAGFAPAAVVVDLAGVGLSCEVAAGVCAWAASSSAERGRVSKVLIEERQCVAS